MFVKSSRLVSNTSKMSTGLSKAKSSSFTESGRCSDEVTLKFDNGKSLYVSESFLSMASPVFDAMFTRDFKEKRNREVLMEGKLYKDVLLLLQCINPAVWVPIPPNNVLQLIPLAEEYQVEGMITRCKEVLTSWTKTLLEKSSERPMSNEHTTNVSIVQSFLQILCLTIELNYYDVEQLAIENLGKCWHGYICGNEGIDFQGLRPVSKETEEIHVSNKASFSSLTDSMKIQILIKRLGNADAGYKIPVRR